ncbi:acyltransferase family protein [Prosthecobacter vanneervenii]|uniref:Peptidoglycan/LPS O-acetylase OafA/YrhL n=1 Tax=Prosthecobacter vanneervenii TaxID=48466 RepID=A0A7W7Y882_9BACT|nr:peptidoglycan/LPS O-acetylase OafA/YrhL [Prosthecobacter vanneervenii]
MPSDISSNRIGKLDALRGAAALMVFLAHCPPGFMENVWWLQPLRDGYGAVLIFFLLSGHVLALQLEGRQPPGYAGFLTRRVFRIWPAYAVVLVLTFAGLYWTQTPVKGGMPGAVARVPGWQDLVENGLFLGDPDAINSPAWSLYVEMRLSVVFPLLLLGTRRLGLMGSLVAGTVFSVAATRLVHVPLPGFLLSLAEASRYVVLFMAGAVLARPQNAVEQLYHKLPFSARAAALAAAVAMIGCKFHPLLVGIPYVNYVGWVGYGVLFVFCLYSGRVGRLLHCRPLLFLGHVSYGLYLLHTPLILLLESHLPPGWRPLVVLAASVLGGWLLLRWVEEPCMALGRRLSKARRVG